MSDAYERVKGGRLLFKGGSSASVSKGINKKKKKKNKKEVEVVANEEAAISNTTEGAEGEDLYTIDAAKKMKYEELFPVEAKKFRYDPEFKSKSVEDRLDDRVKKKADRYCK